MSDSEDLDENTLKKNELNNDKTGKKYKIKLLIVVNFDNKNESRDEILYNFLNHACFSQFSKITDNCQFPCT